MKKIIALILFFIAGVCLQAQTLSWDLKFLKGSVQESIPITQIIRMETGEPFQISIAPASDCYSYIIAIDSGRTIHVLHNTPIKKDTALTLDPIFLQDPAGTETLYVIMSLKKQDKLENLLHNHNKNPKSNRHTNNLHKEIVRLQNEVSNLGEPASSFVTSGGTTRGDPQEYTNRYTDKNLYVRAITIRH